MSRKQQQTDKIYQRIGEFVVCFQWLENRFREVGWLILDPYRREWPPTTLRDLENKDLLNKVAKLHADLLDGLDVPNREETKKNFRSVVSACHKIRQYRNRLLHSAFNELKAGGEVMGIVRSNPRPKLDKHSGDLLFDEEVLSEKAIASQLRHLGKIALSLNYHYIQLIHWSPFDRLRKKSATSGANPSTK